MALGYLHARPGDQITLTVDTTSPSVAFIVASLNDRSLPRESNPVAKWSSAELSKGVAFVPLKLNGYDIFIFSDVKASSPPAPVQIDATVAGQRQFSYAPAFGGAITWHELKVFVAYA